MKQKNPLYKKHSGEHGASNRLRTHCPIAAQAAWQLFFGQLVRAVQADADNDQMMNVVSTQEIGTFYIKNTLHDFDFFIVKESLQTNVIAFAIHYYSLQIK